MELWYQVFKGVTRAVQAVSIKELFVYGREHVPEGPKIIVGNHPNTTDSIVLPYIFTDRLHYLVYKDTFHMPFWGWLLSLAGHIPIGPNIGRDALDQAKERLVEGRSVVILPEGRMTQDQEDRAPGTGAIWLSLETGISLLPLGFYVPPESIRDFGFPSFRGYRGVGRWPVRAKSYVQIGEAWDPAKEMEERPTARVKRELTQQLMQSIRELAGRARELSLA